MQAILNSALPIFALIPTGFICGCFGVFDRPATDNLKRFAVYLALPALMFVAMSKITLGQARGLGFFAAFCGGFSVTFAVAYATSRFRGRRVANASIEGLDAAYSNVGFMGIPMCLLVFGPESAPASIIATLCTACVLFLFAVRVVEIDLKKSNGVRSSWAKVVPSLLRSPLLIAPVAGLAVRLSGLTVPAPFMSFNDSARRRCFASRADLHRTVSRSGASGQPRCRVDQHTRFTEAGAATPGDRVACVVRLLNAAFVVALRGDPERAADRIGAFHHRKTIWPRGRRDFRVDSGVTCIRGPDRLAAGRMICPDLRNLEP
jgi:hypothetical protein